ncbi:MAG: L-seryl-tRNA(Sec) selenium transferase [Gammaproteobacteria bacterium]|nr:L-seryl-tRNA(Sec) selenium transferase [Gammaproteobacteria bacterium]
MTEPVQPRKPDSTNAQSGPRPKPPSIDALLKAPACQDLRERHGHVPLVAALREASAELRARQEPLSPEAVTAWILTSASERLHAAAQSSLRPVFNLSGTVLHTNLGRAPLAIPALEAIGRVAGTASNLEYDLATGRRGDRDVHVEALICRLTGAEAATVVNNNAAAVMAVLAALARRREVIVSRSELVEIGGSFRVPDVMATAGAKLREVGTTNRVHLRDFATAIGPTTALMMKIHPSNYRIEGFTASVAETELAALAREHGIPFVNDLGSGTLVDFRELGLPHEPTVQEALVAGTDLVTFSGDKLLGGPQAGFIAGRADLVRRIKKHPIVRALRVDKLILAALEATLKLYADPERARTGIPALRLLSRPLPSLEAAAERLLPPVQLAMAGIAEVGIAACRSQIGSGALPVDLLPSCALVLTPRRRGGKAVEHLAASLRALPRPVIGRLHQGALHLDLRCLEEVDERVFVDQLALLSKAASP